MKPFRQFLSEAFRYELITLKDNRRLYLRVSDDSGRFVRGTEVNKEGDDIVPGRDEDGRAFTDRMHMLDKDTIASRTRLRMNLVYGELETFTEETERDDVKRGSAKDYVGVVRSWGTPWGSGNAHRAAVKLGDHVEIDVQTFPILADDVVLIHSIEANPSGQGYGTQALRRLIALADKTHVRLALEPLPFTSREGKRVPPSKLKTWYASFGFRTLTSDEHGDAYMIRPPKKKGSM
jgi:hypothetical protein